MAGQVIVVTAAEWPVPSLLRLSADQSAAAAALTRFADSHPGVRILTPHYSDEPWRADIRKGAVPGDDRVMILAAYQPSELLGKLEEIFPPGSIEPGG